MCFTAKFLVLCVLSRVREAYGLEMIDYVSTLTNGRVTLLQGSLYPAFISLEREGYIQKTRQEPHGGFGGRPRQYVALTAKGVAYAREQMETVRLLFEIPETTSIR